MKTLNQSHDCLLLDLDGTVYRGRQPTDGAVEALASSGIRALFVTNNASRTPAEVAVDLRRLGLAAEISTVGLTPVREFAASSAAVVQGHSTSTGWRQLCEAALAIRAGAVWMATNLDAAPSSERGLVPGNGSMVAALRTAVDRAPEVAGKPTSAILARALSPGTFESPLVIGDRLDTDVAAADAAGLPSMLVLAGATSARDAVHAGPEHRTTHIARDLRGLHDDAAEVAVAEHPAWSMDVGRRSISVTATGADPGTDGLSVVRAVAHALWNNDFRDERPIIQPGDDVACVAPHRCALLPDTESEQGRARSTRPRTPPERNRRAVSE